MIGFKEDDFFQSVEISGISTLSFESTPSGFPQGKQKTLKTCRLGQLNRRTTLQFQIACVIFAERPSRQSKATPHQAQ